MRTQRRGSGKHTLRVSLVRGNGSVLPEDLRQAHQGDRLEGHGQRRLENKLLAVAGDEVGVDITKLELLVAAKAEEEGNVRREASDRVSLQRPLHPSESGVSIVVPEYVVRRTRDCRGECSVRGVPNNELGDHGVIEDAHLVVAADTRVDADATFALGQASRGIEVLELASARKETVVRILGVDTRLNKNYHIHWEIFLKLRMQEKSPQRRGREF